MADKGLEDIEQSQIESNYDETVDSFDEMALKAELLRGKNNTTIPRHRARSIGEEPCR